MGTTTTHRGPMGNMRRNISLMWKLLAIIVIIQASGISAKQIQNDLTFDDTFDIDQFEDAASSTKLRSARDLDEQAFIEDELQPVDDSESSNGGSWLMQSVKRVRRELGRLFGGDEKKLVADKKHAKGALKAERQRKRQAKQAEKQKRKALAASVARNNKAKSRLNKRQSYDDVEGSGDENENDNEGFDKWQILFTVSEPWQEEYRMGKGHRVFDDLERQIHGAFEDFASHNYNDDDEFYLQPTLMRVNRVPSDSFKIYCIVQLDLPERWSDFGDRLRQYLVSYKRFGDLGADADSNYYFRRVKELSNEYLHNTDEHHGDGLDMDHGSTYHAGGVGAGAGAGAGGADSAHHNVGGPVTTAFEDSQCDHEGYFHCRNGEVIDCAERCDNKADCEDDSDEDEEMCRKFFENEPEEEDLEVEEDLDGDVNGHGQGHDLDQGHHYVDPDTNGYDPYDYDREQEMERERQLEIQRERERQIELERERQRQHELEREREEQERARQYEEEQRAREQYERERAEEEKRAHEQEHGYDHESQPHEGEEDSYGHEYQPESQPGYGHEYDPYGHEYQPESQPGYGQDYDHTDEPEHGEPDYDPSYGHEHQPESQPGHGQDYDHTDEPEHGESDYDPSYGHEYQPESQPGYGHESQPGYGHESQPGYGHESQPGYGHESQPGYGHESQPGYGHESQPGYGHESQPGYGHESQPGYGQPEPQPRHDQDYGHSYGQPEHTTDKDGDEAGEVYDCHANPQGYFACRSGELVPCYTVCNNRFDCRDASDEDDCHTESTEDVPVDAGTEDESHHHYGVDEVEASGEGYVTETSPVYTRGPEVGCRGDTTFTCPESGRVICEEQLCDGEEQCPDGEDELNCGTDGDGEDGGDNQYEPEQCQDNEFRCDNRCLPKEYQCNGVHECIDNTDELNCPEKECRPDEFKCRSGDCIDGSKRCNRVQDCPDGDDEDERCPAECSDIEYQCRDGINCISESRICDGKIDCLDGDDEEHCDSSGDDYYNGGDDYCKHYEFRCNNGQCIPLREVCDNIYDCDDYSDESDCDSHDMREDIFDEDEIIRDYAPHHRRPATSAPHTTHYPSYKPIGMETGNVLHEMDLHDYYYYHPDVYNKANHHNPCSERQFRCGNNVCIPLHLRCDGFYHCNDMTDEFNCEEFRADQEKPYTEAPPANVIRTSTTTTTDASIRNTTYGYPRYSTTTSTTTTTTTTTTTPAPTKKTCLSMEFMCESGDCIPLESVCDGIGDCKRMDDESYGLCHCSSDKFKCIRGGGCIPKTQVCDGKPQCRDGSDEISCHFNANFNKTRNLAECLSFQFQCADGICIAGYKLCNGITDCLDGSDEINCPINYDEANYEDFVPEDPLSECDIYEFECDYSRCIPIEKKCDGYPDCDDETDEIDCPPFTDKCNENEFECDESFCILRDQQCNGVPNCNDGTDEKNCTFCRQGAYLCNTGQCILESLHCNGHNDCADGSDEHNCECPNLQMKCNGTCVSWHLVDICNGIIDCAEGSDEFDCDVRDINHINITIKNDHCSKDQWQCDNFECISKRHVCDRYFDCSDHSDEMPKACETKGKDENDLVTTVLTPEDCEENQFFCDDDCHPISIRCNGQYDCADRSDEEECSRPTRRPPTYPCPQHTCPDGQCYSESERCDGISQCSDGSDEAECCAADQYRCRNGDCVPGYAHCNGRHECPDYSDEEDCADPIPAYPSRCSASQFRCDSGQCISAMARCNGYTDCLDSSDEKHCRFNLKDSYYEFEGLSTPQFSTSSTSTISPLLSSATSSSSSSKACGPLMYRCENGPCIPLNLRCNGNFDCPLDISDELDCPEMDNSIDSSVPTTASPQLNLKTYPDNQIIKERYIREGREVIFRCRDEGMLRAKVRWTRPGGRGLPVGSRDKDGRLEIPNIRVEDSGTYICEAVGYPRHVPGQQVSVQLTVEKFNPRDERLPSACSNTQATCLNGECIDKSQICDGIPHCSDGSDEHSCSHGRKCHPNQFMCRNSKCVDRVWRCDGEDDCGDNSDEESCDPEPSGAPCRYDEFQCRSGHCIPKSFQCDDTNDCRDGSDEIGCMAPEKVRDPPPTANLKQGESLNLTCVGVGTPTPVIVWRLNWGHVPEKCESKTFSGTGSLYCPDMQVGDSGAYSCEIINTKGSKFATDTLVTVEPPSRPGVCPAGFFNMLARRPEECINCFCFGITKSCKSAELFNYAIQPPITSHRVVDVELSPYSSIVINENPAPGILNLRHGVQFRASDVLYGSRSAPYLALPTDYMGNQLKSYGGFIKYDVSFMGQGRPTNTPDVIITGNGFTLTYRSRMQPQPNIVNHMEIQFTPGQWKKPDGRVATREEIMMILANVDNVLIRLSYIDATERQVELTNILMNSAGEHDQGLGQASLIEQCSCPEGYVGDSCESCAPGYVRQPGGPWLGRCVRFTPEPCPVGTYGDPRRGIPCRECPCPQAGANNFASGCSLGPDNEVTCNCNEGYTGRRCEICAPGYSGQPLVPGGRCYPIPESTCNAEGTLSINADGSCTCKPLVTGARCDSCKADSFHLNSFTYTGCIECFCSGLPTSCGSSSWYRDQISSSFGRSSAPHGFGLITNYNTDKPTNVRFSQSGNFLTFSEPRTSETLYWQLPAQFLGNKITAYGGKLNYTLSYTAMPGGLMSRSSSPDVVIKSGEDLTIIHYRRSGVSPSSSNSYSVPIIESAWHRSDGQPVNRQHLLMALSKIDAIYIKATYTTSTKDGSLTQVSMDIATPNNLGTARAVEVEECRCPEGYIGLSCERCAPGYKRNPEAGLYLGVCEPCECNGHSTQCDSETGVCLNCADNTEGESCERCAYGYTGDATNGTPYDCQPGSGTPYPPPPSSSSSNQTCGHCNPDGTDTCDNGYCYCKANVQGTYCDQCRPGTYDLSASNPDGCTECYCSHKSTTCRSASLYRQLIPVDFLSNPPLFTDEEGNIADTQNLNFDIESNEYTYSHSSYTPKFWSIRGSVLGNQLYSYGGILSYKLSVQSYGNYEPGHDVVLIGNGQKLLWSRPSNEQDNTEYKVRLHEDENWQSMQLGSMQRASRVDFMNVLSNLEHILIRATPKIPTTRTIIGDVILESAVETRYLNAQPAGEIEICTCPPGYSGTSCESCAPMHYRDNNGNCLACPCQDDTTSSCSLDERGYVKCQCRSGYTGDRCQNPEGYEPETPSPRPTPDTDFRTQITVSIAPPEITIIPVGGSITLTCSGHMAWNGNPVIVSWYKLNDRMPYGNEQSNGVLRLYDLQIHDSGVYICRATNNETRRVFEDKISITITESSRRAPAKIDNLQPYFTFEEYEPSEVNCEVSGNPTPNVIWTRVDGQMSSEARVEGSRLIFEMPRKSDEGSYRCQADNGVGYEEKYTQIRIRPAIPAPTPAPRELVYIDPPSFSGASGERVLLTCQPTTAVILKYEWTKDGYPLYRQQNLIINGNNLEIRNASPHDSGLYTCIGIDQRNQRNYTSDAQVYIEDTRPVYPGEIGSGGPIGTGSQTGSSGIRPSVQRLPEEHRVIQGHDFSITCEATGTPYPSIKWTKVHESLGDNVHQSGNVLRIINARPDNRGIYLCIVENEAGNDQTSTFVDIEPREHPIVDIDPKEPQVISVGGQGLLYCSATGIPQPRVQWLRVNGQPLSHRHQAQHGEPGYIVIEDVKLEDAGDYKCVAENEVGNATAVATIRVIESPVITLEPNQEVLTVTEGDEVKVSCIATGIPNPSVRWVEDSSADVYNYSPDADNYNEAFLEFARVSISNGKAYKCVATNEAGTDERYVVLDVKPRRGDAPEDSDVDRYPYDRQPSRPYPPQPSYPSQPSYPPQPSYPSQPSYPTQPGYNYPQYPYGQSQPHPENVYQSKPGDNVTLNCDLSAAYKTMWVREDGRPLPPNSQFERNSLIIHHMQENNAGKYRCNAYDSRGEIITYILAELVYIPIPHITLNPRMPIHVNANDNIDISCDVEGAQPIIVSWHTDNNRPLPPSVSIEGKYLRFISITPAAAGRYYCSASNSYGNTTEMAEVIVNRGHTYEARPQAKNYDLSEGESVRIACDVDHLPIRGDVHYTWTREDGKRLPANVQIRGHELYIFNVHKQDEGRYVCEAYANGIRSKPSYAELNIKRGHSINDIPCMVLYICTDYKPLKTYKTKAPSTAAASRTTSYACQPSDFKCVSHPHTCVAQHMVCDGIHDCTDHSDEFNCTREQMNYKRWKKHYYEPINPFSPLDLYKKRHKRKFPQHGMQKKKAFWGHLKTKQNGGKSAGIRPLAPAPYYPPTLVSPTPRHRDTMLRVDQQQSKLRVGESTEVECYSSDNSYTDVIWERADGKPLPPHLQQIGNRLIITHVTPNDAGRYVCKCKTDEGDLYTTSYELDIEASVHEWKHPKIVHADVGSRAQLSCNAENAYEGPGYRWSRQYGQMQMGTDILNDKLHLADVQANDAGTYICTATTADGQSVDYPTILVVTGAIPHFHQDPISYMSFPTLRDSYIKFNFDITFRPEQPNGLLLFNGQKKGNGDYISLSLNERYPEFRFDFDGKTMVVRAEHPVELNEWHTVRVNRFRRDGYMQVDDQHPVAFPTLSPSSSLDLVDDLYLGAVPSWDILPKDAVDQTVGFVGCVSRLTLQGSIIELMKDAKVKDGITPCQPCQDSPCQNGGICLESQTEMAYTCICQQGWTGRNCAVKGTQCTPGICGTGRCENTETGMECLCPLNKTGDRCQYIEHLNENSLAFKKNSFAAYGTPRASKLNIKFQIRPNTLEDAVLLYAAESKLPSGDFVAVVLRNKHVELIINTGARLKPVVVRSHNPIPVNKWTEIEIARRFGEGILRVGNEPEQKAKAAGAARTLYIKTPLYVGGYDHEKITLNRDVNVSQGFDGCVSNLYEGLRQINLIADIQDAANIQNCGEINEIEQNETFAHEDQTTNENSDFATLDACASDPCENGGTCQVVDDLAVCTCSVGFAGKHCEEHITLQFDVNFHGNGYLELNRSQFDENIEQKYSFAAMVFSTTDPNGLLLWWGQPKGEAFNGQDFMALALVDGIIEFAFRLNGEEAVLRNPDKRVDDGIRHIVLIKRTDNTAILELDHVLYAGETIPTGKNTMSLPGHVFIGGAPDLDAFTGSRYKNYFNGCVRVVEGENSGIIEVGKVAVSGINVDTCPDTDEDNDGTEPPVV
ncbi:terribly reduced optic lobes isoform 6-T6 [Cochliomyia hominivorax]